MKRWRIGSLISQEEMKEGWDGRKEHRKNGRKRGRYEGRNEWCQGRKEGSPGGLTREKEEWKRKSKLAKSSSPLFSSSNFNYFLLHSSAFLFFRRIPSFFLFPRYLSFSPLLFYLFFSILLFHSYLYIFSSLLLLSSFPSVVSPFTDGRPSTSLRVCSWQKGVISTGRGKPGPRP